MFKDCITRRNKYSKTKYFQSFIFSQKVENLFEAFVKYFKVLLINSESCKFLVLLL